MTRQVLEQIVNRAISDASFRQQLRTNPGAALREYKLSKDEVGALTSGDPTRLSALGVDQRMSRLFAISDSPNVWVGDDMEKVAEPFIGSGSRGTIDTDARDPGAAAAGTASPEIVGSADPLTGVTSATKLTHLQMVEQDIDAQAAGSSGAPSHLQMVEQDLATAESQPSTVTTHLQQVETDLDTSVPDQIPNAE